MHAFWVFVSIDLLCTAICWNVLYLGNKGVDKCQWFRWSDEAQMWFRGLGLQPETWRVAESRARWATDGVQNPLRWLQVLELLAFCSATVTPSTRQSIRKKVKKNMENMNIIQSVKKKKKNPTTVYWLSVGCRGSIVCWRSHKVFWAFWKGPDYRVHSLRLCVTAVSTSMPQDVLSDGAQVT